MGSLWVSYGINLGQLWDQFGSVMGSLWVSYGITLGQLGITLGQLWLLFGKVLGILATLWDTSGYILVFQN
jgi:hypothetical protein